MKHVKADPLTAGGNIFRGQIFFKVIEEFLGILVCKTGVFWLGNFF